MKTESETIAELLRCPFCGSKPEIQRDDFVTIECQKCGQAQVICVEEKDAVSDWNRRAPISQPEPIAAPQEVNPVFVSVCTSLSRAEFHDKAWSSYHNKCIDDTMLKKASIHTIRTIFDSIYDSIPKQEVTASESDGWIPIEAAPIETKKEAWSFDDENFKYGSLGDLLDSHDEIEPGHVVYVGTAIAVEANELCSADDIIDMIADRASDIVGEYAEDYPDVSKEEIAELDTLICTWIKKCCNPGFYRVENVKQFTITEDILK